MGFVNHVKFWSDVLDPRLDEKAAPSLGGVHLGREEPVYSDSAEFFRRTLVTRYMADVLENVVEVLAGRGGNKLIMLLSLFGGGKTHTLLTVYHAVRNPAALLEAKTESEDTRNRLRRLAEELTRIGSVRIVVLDGHFKDLAPTPVNPLEVPGYKIQTIWGSLAHQLGRFGEVRGNDEKLLAPPADVVAKLFGEEPVLILADELADYAVRLKTSGDSVLRNYGDQVLSFIECLAKAVDLSRRTTLVVSLPVEEKKEQLKVEERYKPSLNVVMSLHKSVSRVGPRKVLPVAPSDMPSILRVRIFESVDQGVAKSVASNLARIYGTEENREIFGEDAVRKAHRVEETYPYHPSYVETLVDIVDKHEGLEKTRDAIRITRKVVRRLKEVNSDAELVMPYHIDLEDREFRGALLSHELYRQYESVIEDDIVGRTMSFEKPDLARTVAKTVLVKTFIYAGSLRQHQFYPTAHDVLISSFEPSASRTLGLQVKDYLDALEWASSNLAYLLSEGGRYWFTLFASPIRRVEMTAKTVHDGEALKKALDYAWRLMAKSYEEVVSGPRKRAQRREVSRSPFSASSSMVLSEPKQVDQDSREYVLLALISTPREGDIERMIFETPAGGLRRNANTIYLIYPRDSSTSAQILGFAKYLVACDIVSEELGSLYEDSEIREVMSKKLQKYCRGMEGIEGKLVINILAGLNTVAYPSFDEQRHRNTYKLAESSMADTIIEVASRALRSPKVQKLYEELDFELLDYMLSQIGIHISEGESPRSVEEIVDYFYSNPRLPMVSTNVVKEALIDGVRNLKIGIKKSGKLFYKKISECRSKSECHPPALEEGEPPPSLELGDIVVPWRAALLEQLESLKHVREERVVEGVKKVWYACYIEGNLYSIADAMSKFNVETLRLSPLVKITELVREGIELKLDKYEVTSAPGEVVNLIIVVDRVGPFKGDLLLSASTGTLSPERVSIGDEAPSATVEWKIEVPEHPGTYTYEVRIVTPSGELLKTSSVSIIVKPRGRVPTRGVPPKGTKISLIEIDVPAFNFKPVRVADSKFGSEYEVEEAALELEAEVTGRTPRVDLKLSRVSMDDVKSIFPSIAQRYGVSIRHMKYRIKLRPRGKDYAVAPEISESEARDIANYMTYYAYEED